MKIIFNYEFDNWNKTIAKCRTNYYYANTQKKKETVTRLQKAIATLNEAHKLSYNELGEPSFEKTTA